VTGFVVTGGHSRRMGRDKASLPWAGTTLLDHAIARVRAAVPGEVVLLAGDSGRYADRKLTVLADAYPDAGPLSAILAGLEHTPGGGGLFLAVDLPAVPTSLLRHLVALRGDRDAVVPVSASGPEPLCAVYGPGCADPIRRRLAAGERKMTCFWPDVRVRLVEIRASMGHGSPERIFLNVNSPEDYDRARDEG
jgi:molybdenum cofactor guanylyltransferase